MSWSYSWQFVSIIAVFGEWINGVLNEISLVKSFRSTWSLGSELSVRTRMQIANT